MKIFKKIVCKLMIFGLLLMLGACAVVPKELDSLGQDDGNTFARRVILPVQNKMYEEGLEQVGADSNFLFRPTFARGDLLRIKIIGMDQFDGLYKISERGTLELPFAPSFIATGQSRSVLIKKIEHELVRLNWFYTESVQVDLSVVKYAPINVSVTGAVFNPGRVLINSKPITKPDDVIQHMTGAFSSERDLISALIAAGGVRPDASLSEVYLKRGDAVHRVSLDSLINGHGFAETPMLIDGDQIVVLSTGVINPLLIKPSQLTPPGMRIFISNLTAPALNNAQSAVGADATRLPYGSSLLDSAISANCIGGTQQANASRSIVLITRNLGSNQQVVVRRSINQLLANSSNQSVNPFMMPNDGVACYDSKFTNFRDVARGIGEVISPVLVGRLL